MRDKLKHEIKISGLVFNNPTVLASGILGTSATYLREIALAGAGAVTTKSIGLKPQTSYSNPTVIQVECGILNAIGLENPGINYFVQDIKKLNDLEIPLIVSIFGFSIDEYIKVAIIAAESGANALELNLSCPHVKGTGSEIGKDPKRICEVVKLVKSSVSIPVFVKLTPNVDDNMIGMIAQAIERAGADAISLINTVKVENVGGIKVGGLSGRPIKETAIRMIKIVRQAVSVPIIGMGGIYTVEDVVEFLQSGCQAVAVGTARFANPLIIMELIKGLEKYCQDNGIENMSQLCGAVK